MNIWRMKLRAGSHGDDMLPACRERGIAAITYQAIFNTDLTHLDPSGLDAGVKGSARSSMFRFAWEIRGGDVILVGDSVSKSIVARGFVSTAPGPRAYRYNRRNPVIEPSNPQVAWRHEVPVEWDEQFEQFPYRDGAPLITVMHFDSRWSQATVLNQSGAAHTRPDEAFEQRQALNEDGYMRQTHASLRNIERLHAALSNRFNDWLKKRFGVAALQERNRVDLTFEHAGMTHLAELKICYGANTRAAIREAMGQLLEYNHYPPRSEAQSWWLVLDHHPASTDRDYISLLRDRYALPLRLAWPVNSGFDSYPEWPSVAEG